MSRPKIDFEWLKATHARKQLQLTTGVGLSGTVHLDNDPQAFVTELIRLAEIGQKLEIQIGERVKRLDA
ncbi:hypothetical protein [Brevundimonas nasdae]|uniref:hypothetical protein n=1 Tax=Brevundimonas nasdae TaxID=172043 RepID=UPI003F68D75F